MLQRIERLMEDTARKPRAGGRRTDPAPIGPARQTVQRLRPWRGEGGEPPAERWAAKRDPASSVR